MIRFAIALTCTGCLSKPEFPDVADPPVLDSHIVAGDRHVCAIDASGTLACWGNNHEGELGVLAPDRSGTPLRLGSNWTAISAGTQHTCGIQGGVVVCWGDSKPPAPITLPITPVRIFAGGDGACAIDAGGSLYCWGLVDPTSAPFATPRQVTPAGIAGPWQEVRISADHACALTTGGDAYCWGHDDLEQLGVVGGDVSLAIAIQPTTRQFLTLAAGQGASCGITTDHTLACWGAPYATGGATPSGVVEIDPAPLWSSVAVGTAHVCGISDHGVRCYGSDSRGALGDDFAARAMLPSNDVVDNALEVVAGDGFTCTHQDDDSKQCWGTNERGELGNGEIATEPLPVPVDIGGLAVRLTVGDGHSCATRIDNVVMCWGDNRLGQVRPTSTNPFEPTPQQATVGSDLVTAGSHHTCARDVTNHNTITCWGDDSLQQVNGGRTIVAPLNTWTTLSAGGDATCAVDGPGDLICWGAVPRSTGPIQPTMIADNYTTVGVGLGLVTGVQTMMTSTNVVEWADAGADCSLSAGAGASAPELIDDAGGLPTQLAAGSGHACRMEGDVPTFLFCWGGNDRGQAAYTNGPCAVFNAPNTVVAGLPWAEVIDGSLPQVATGGDRSCAISSMDTGSQLLCWGDNTGHFLAPLIATDHTNDPEVAVPGAWATIAIGPNHACGIDQASQVLCWGPNEFGEVGNGFRFHANPVEVVAPEPPP